MSNVRTVKASQLTDSRCLTRTLTRMGYTPVAGANQTIRGDQQFDSRQGFDIVLKQEDTKLKADIGFKKNAKGAFDVTMDQYVIREFTLQDFVKKVGGEYLETKARMTAEAAGAEFMASQPVTVNGRNIIRLTYIQA